MELILHTDSESSIARIIALAKKLNVSVELRGTLPKTQAEKEELLSKILNFKASRESSFRDAVEWQKNERG